MRILILRWLATTLAILMIPMMISGVRVDGVPAALTTAAILGALNALARPILIFLTLPLTILSLGFFLLIINALLFYWAGSLVSGVHISSFGTAIVASFLVTVISWIIQAPWRMTPRVVIRTGEGQSRAGRRPSAAPDGSTIEMAQDEDGKWH